MMMNPETFRVTLQTMWAGLSPADREAMRPYVEGTCGVLGQTALAQSGMPTPSQAQAGGCGCGGKGGCAGGSCGMGGGGGGGSTIPGIPSNGGIPGVPLARGSYPACYTDCRDINPCLRPYLENQALQIDAFSLLELYKNEAEIVHQNVSVGAAPFNSALPLAANQSIVYVQEAGQQLAYVPGLLKVKATFSDGNDHQADLGLTLYAGPRGLTGITSLGASSGLTIIGRAYTFEDFQCGTSCYLAPWPKLFNCSNQVIPGERCVYAVVNAGALGAVTVTSLSIVTIKANTDQFVNCCKQMGK